MPNDKPRRLEYSNFVVKITETEKDPAANPRPQKKNTFASSNFATIRYINKCIKQALKHFMKYIIYYFPTHKVNIQK